MVAAARRAPKGAPNILLIMTDDEGYGVPSTFGGVTRPPLSQQPAAVDAEGKICVRHMPSVLHNEGLALPAAFAAFIAVTSPSWAPPGCGSRLVRECQPSILMLITAWSRVNVNQGSFETDYFAASTLYAARGRRMPLSVNSPTGSTFTAFSTFINTRGLMRI